jgi:hypothetical protein
VAERLAGHFGERSEEILEGSLFSHWDLVRSGEYKSLNFQRHLIKFIGYILGRIMPGVDYRSIFVFLLLLISL